MHPIVTAAELRLLICEMVAEAKDPDNGLPHRKADLLSLALTCKKFFPCALEMLWRTTPSLQLLIKVFPCNLWKMKTCVVDFYSETGQVTGEIQIEQLVFQRRLEDKDWSRFGEYAFPVQTLNVSTVVDEKSFCNVVPEVDFSVLKEMARSRSLKSWIPNLKSIHFNGMHYDNLFAQHFFNSSIKSLRIDEIIVEGYFPEMTANYITASTVTSILESAAIKALNLRTLEVLSGFSCHRHPDLLANLMKTLPLENLALQTNGCDNKIMLNAISNLNLTRLRLDFAIESVDAWHTVAKPASLFPHLTVFEARVGRLGNLTKFLKLLARPKLKTLDVRYPCETSTTSFTGFLNTLALNCDTTQLETFSIVGSARDWDFQITVDDISQARGALMQFLSLASNVTDLSLRAVPYALLTEIDTALLEELAALPNMRRICLGSADGAHGVCKGRFV